MFEIHRKKTKRKERCGRVIWRDKICPEKRPTAADQDVLLNELKESAPDHSLVWHMEKETNTSMPESFDEILKVAPSNNKASFMIENWN